MTDLTVPELLPIELNGLRVWIHAGSSNNSLTIPILLCHGGPGVPDYLQDVAVELVKRTGRTVVRWDQRGSGGSTTTGDDTVVTVERHLSDMELIRQHLAADKVIVVGHSWGGLLALLYIKAYATSVAGIAVLSPATGCGKTWEAMEMNCMSYNRSKMSNAGFLVLGLHSLRSMLLPGAWADAGHQATMRIIWANYFKEPSRAPEPDETWVLGCRANAAFGTRNDLVKMCNDETHMPTKEDVQDVPMFILYGSRDIYGEKGPASMARRFPAVDVEVLEDCGHVSWLDQPDQLYQRLDAFLEQVV